MTRSGNDQSSNAAIAPALAVSTRNRDVLASRTGHFDRDNMAAISRVNLNAVMNVACCKHIEVIERGKHVLQHALLIAGSAREWTRPCFTHPVIVAACPLGRCGSDWCSHCFCPRCCRMDAPSRRSRCGTSWKPGGIKPRPAREVRLGKSDRGHRGAVPEPQGMSRSADATSPMPRPRQEEVSSTTIAVRVVTVRGDIFCTDRGSSPDALAGISRASRSCTCEMTRPPIGQSDVWRVAGETADARIRCFRALHRRPLDGGDKGSIR